MLDNINTNDDDDVIMMDVNSLFNGSVEIVEVNNMDEVIKHMNPSKEEENK